MLSQNKVTQVDMKNPLMEDGMGDRGIIDNANTVKTGVEPDTAIPQALASQNAVYTPEEILQLK